LLKKKNHGVTAHRRGEPRVVGATRMYYFALPSGSGIEAVLNAGEGDARGRKSEKWSKVKPGSMWGTDPVAVGRGSQR